MAVEGYCQAVGDRCAGSVVAADQAAQGRSRDTAAVSDLGECLAGDAEHVVPRPPVEEVSCWAGHVSTIRNVCQRWQAFAKKPQIRRWTKVLAV